MKEIHGVFFSLFLKKGKTSKWYILFQSLKTGQKEFQEKNKGLLLQFLQWTRSIKKVAPYLNIPKPTQRKKLRLF